ncbi:MAG: BTAD domain-containing putative transcriptional regulator [Chloroflexota bacterium]|nr:BTAD domain-containing putative transcriptional regulator [Chloroflexota bacterium]
MNSQWDGLPSQLRILVVHPQVNTRCWALAAALEGGALYLRIGADETEATLEKWFLSELTTIVSSSRATRREIVLDECDCAVPEAVLAFAHKVIVSHPRWRITLVTRTTPHLMFCDPILRPVMRYLPTIDGIATWDHLARSVDTYWLEVNALGRGRAHIDGRVIEQWSGSLPRTLFFFLMDRGLMTRAEIFETFWPDMKIVDATNVFHVTKRKIAEVLKLKAGQSITQFDSGYYHIAGELQVAYDVNQFTELYTRAQMMDGEEALDALESAVALYRADFLSGIDMAWAVARRAELRTMFAELLVLLAQRYTAMNEPIKAYGTYLRAAARDAAQPELAHAIMSLSRDLKTQRDGIHIYERLIAEQRKHPQAAPIDSRTVALYEQLRTEAGM